MKIKVSHYNEVAPSEIKRLVEAGAKIIPDENPMCGYCIAVLGWEHGKPIKVYSVDSIKIHNVVFPLASGSDDYFCEEIEIQ